MKTKYRQQSRAKRLFRDPNAMAHAFYRVSPFTATEATQLEMPVRLAFDDMRYGRASSQDFLTLADAINICTARSHEIDPTCVEVCHRAMDAIQRAKERWQRIGKWGLDGPAIQDLATMLDLYTQVLTLSTPQQILTAAKRVIKEIRAGHVHTDDEPVTA